MLHVAQHLYIALLITKYTGTPVLYFELYIVTYVNKGYPQSKLYAAISSMCIRVAYYISIMKFN